jgi:hypothetical protein
MLIRHLWQLKTVVFMHWCLLCAVLFPSMFLLLHQWHCDLTHFTSQKGCLPMFSMFMMYGFCINIICGLWYKHITIVNYDSSIVNKFAASLTDDSRHHLRSSYVYSTGHWFPCSSSGATNSLLMFEIYDSIS